MEEVPKRNPKKEIANQFKTPLIRINPVKKSWRLPFFFSTGDAMSSMER
jgi:hypothetical protein